MKIYKAGQSQITIGAETYRAGPDGTIDIPDGLARVAFSKGFVNATNRQPVAAKAVQPEPIPEPAPIIDAPKPTKPAVEVVAAAPKINNTKEANQ